MPSPVESDAFLLCPMMNLGCAQARKAQVRNFIQSAGAQVVDLMARYVTKAMNTMGTKVSATMEGGAQEPLLTPFIESVDISFIFNCT